MNRNAIASRNKPFLPSDRRPGLVFERAILASVKASINPLQRDPERLAKQLWPNDAGTQAVLKAATSTDEHDDRQRPCPRHSRRLCRSAGTDQRCREADRCRHARVFGRREQHRHPTQIWRQACQRCSVDFSGKSYRGEILHARQRCAGTNMQAGAAGRSQPRVGRIC